MYVGLEACLVEFIPNPLRPKGGQNGVGQQQHIGMATPCSCIPVKQ